MTAAGPADRPALRRGAVATLIIRFAAFGGPRNAARHVNLSGGRPGITAGGRRRRGAAPRDTPIRLRAPPDRPAARLRLGALVVGALFIFGLAYAIAVRTRRGQELDDAAFLGREAATAEAAHAARVLLATISVGSLALALLVLVVIAFGRGRPRLAFVVGAATTGAVVTSEALKHVVLGRPMLLADSPNVHNTFPSGHSTVAMSVALAAVLVVPRHWRGATALVGLVYAGSVGAATLVAGAHRPSDVAGGFAVSTAWAAAGALVLVVWRGAGDARTARAARDTPQLATLLAGIGAGLVVAAFVVLVGVVGRGDELFVLDNTRAFVAAAVSIGAIATLFGAALLAALRDVTLDPPVPADARLHDAPSRT
jgi:membrane-associated phospholipid phosphatase